MDKPIRTLIATVLVIIALSAFFSFWNIDQNPPEEINLNTLVSQINEDKIEKLEVQNNTVTATLKEEESGEKKKQTTKKEAEASLTETLSNYEVNQEKLQNLNIEVKEDSGLQLWATYFLPSLLPILLIGVAIYFVARSVQRGNTRAMMFGKSTAKKADPQKNKVTFKDVAGVKEAKQELSEVVDFLKSAKKYQDLGAQIPKGVLLVGPPGTGKTLLARAIAGEANVPFFHIAGSEFVEMFVGVGASRVRDLFSQAKKASPAILFVDEIDAVGRQRGAGLGGSHDEREQTLNQILTEMDGFEQDTNVIVIAATNRPDVLDPALLRPGRFDRQVTIGSPDIKDREQILKIHAKGKPLAKDINLNRLAQRTPGFSGADLKNLMNEAAILTARHNEKEITQKRCYQAIERVMLGPERKSFVLGKEEKEIAAYHEAGHALVAHIQPNTDPVQKISIISRGQAAGFTLKTPEKEKHFHSKQDFKEEIAVMLAGMAAEEIIYGKTTTGASSDLRATANLARKMITQYGMSKDLGPLAFGEKDELVFLGREIGEQKNYSEEVAAKIDKEVQSLAKEGFETAKKILLDNKDKLEKLTKELIAKESIERDEFEEMFGAKTKTQESTV